MGKCWVRIIFVMGVQLLVPRFGKKRKRSIAGTKKGDVVDGLIKNDQGGI